MKMEGSTVFRGDKMLRILNGEYWILQRPDCADAMTTRMLHAHARNRAIGQRRQGRLTKGGQGGTEMRESERERERCTLSLRPVWLIQPVAALHITYIVTRAQYIYIYMPASLSLFASLFLSFSLVHRYAGERQPPLLVSPYGLILTLVLPPLRPPQLWARRCWYHRGNQHSIRRDESILFQAKNKLLVGVYLARSSFRAAYLLSSTVSLLPSRHPFPPLSLITFLRGLPETWNPTYVHFLVTFSVMAFRNVCD